MASSPNTPYNDVQTVTPIMHDFDKTSDSYITNFLKNADGFVANKFHVGFRGEYVEKALKVMEINASGDKYTHAPKLFHSTAATAQRFKEWLGLFWNPTSRMLSMFWNCSKVTLPRPTLEMLPMNCMDSLKSINFELPKKIQSGTVNLEIVDNKHLMWFNFFNALFNCQISPLVLKPKSGFHKIDMNVEVLNENIDLSGSKINTTDLDVIHMSEYNSIVLKQAPVVSPDNASTALYTFSVEFSVPNTLNGTFKRSDRGLKDNTTSAATLGVGKTKDGLAYNMRFWEYSSNNGMQNTRNNYEVMSPSDLTTFKQNKNQFTQLK